MNIATTRNEARWRGTPCHCPNTEVPLSLQSLTNPESIFVTHIGGTARDNCDNPLIESIGTHLSLPRPPAYRLTPSPGSPETSSQKPCVPGCRLWSATPEAPTGFVMGAGSIFLSIPSASPFMVKSSFSSSVFPLVRALCGDVLKQKIYSYNMQDRRVGF